MKINHPVSSIYIFFSLALTLLFGQAMAQDIKAVDVTQGLDPEMREAMLQLEPWLKNAQAAQMGPFKIYAPEDSKIQKLWVVVPEQSKHIAIEKENISIVLNNSPNDMFSVSDTDGNGTFETVSY